MSTADEIAMKISIGNAKINRALYRFDLHTVSPIRRAVMIEVAAVTALEEIQQMGEAARRAVDDILGIPAAF